MIKDIEIERKFLVDKNNVPDLEHYNFMEINQWYMQDVGVI